MPICRLIRNVLLYVAGRPSLLLCPACASPALGAQVVWALTLVVSVKYVFFVLMADAHGEGGVFAELALLSPSSMSKRAYHVSIF